MEKLNNKQVLLILLSTILNSSQGAKITIEKTLLLKDNNNLYTKIYHSQSNDMNREGFKGYFKRDDNANNFRGANT